MMLGFKIGGTAGLAIGGIVGANILGFPEVEVGEGVLALGAGLEMLGDAANVGLVGGALGGGIGIPAGLASTQATCGGGP